MSTLPVLDVAIIATHSKIHGPGTRFVIWLQGCSRLCKGCANTDLWPFDKGKKYTVRDLFEKITGTKGIEGVTITGGEPLDQVDPVLHLMRLLKTSGMTIVLYSGYELPEINADVLKREALEIADIAIIGRYQEENRSTHLRWRGSSNKQFIFHNEAYKKIFENLEDINEVEIHIDDDGKIIITGYPDKDIREYFANAKIIPR
ncbi:MAG: 4Fe-4S single cluster domain-containing protein [Candidatus Sigynarchaeota archaeon]